MNNIHEYAYLGKDFCKTEDAKISVMTHAFLYGTAVFEGIRAYWNKDKEKIYLLQAIPHLKRLENSCKLLRMNPYYNHSDMLDIIIKLIQKNQPKQDSYIRPSWFKSCLRIGPSLVSPNGAQDEDSFVVTTLNLGDYVSTTEGLKVQVSSWRRLSDNAIPPRAKINGSYANTAIAKANAALSGFDDSIFLTEDGMVSEGSAMNLFLIKDKQLITPAHTDNILEGITRNFIIQIAKEELGLEVVTRRVSRTELYTADEAFFCGTGAQIAAIGYIDHYQIGSGKLGEITKEIQDFHHQVCIGESSKYTDQVTEVSY